MDLVLGVYTVGCNVSHNVPSDVQCLFLGHMQYLYDLEGNRYLDMFAGIATVIAGHCHPKIQEV